jgi:hypothetical protein
LRSVSSFLSFTNNAAKSDMTGGRIDRLRMARGRSVTAATVGRAQMRAAFQDFAGADWVSVDPEFTNGDAMTRRLFRIKLVGSHAKRAARDTDHAFGTRYAGRITVGKQI